MRKVGQGVTLFAYDEVGHLLGEYTPGGVMVREYVWLGDRLVGMLSQQEKGVLYVHADHLGTPRAVSNGATVLWRWEGEAFGHSAPNEQVAGVLRRLTMPLRFPGQYHDSETGLFYNYFRDYRPASGRYVESDPIGLVGGANTYAYVLGDPVSAYDFFGLTAEQIQQMWQEAARKNPDLDFGRDYDVEDLGPGVLGETSVFGGISLDDRYLHPLNEAQVRDMYDTIVHEGLHNSQGFWGRLMDATVDGRHPDIYEEARRRVNEQFPTIGRCW
ncbi:MAG: RHS repeat-associated core domain-containing protein [Pseudomonadota bacterium]